ncbi:MAG TPA: hypothetical protein VFR84_14620 [Candidatus Angelobacter sp.]|nr:hypothetical protein [Candidatus Angelobacter sp.]
MPERIFTPRDSWSNGFYLLIINLEQRSDDHSRSALEAVQTYPQLDGWYMEREKEPYEQPRVKNAGGDLRNHRYGVFTLPNGKKVPCGCFVFHTDYEPDWLEFYIPLAALDKIYPTGAFPFGVSQGYTDWEREVDSALFELARHIHQYLPFPAGIIGFEPRVDDMQEIYSSAVTGVPPHDLRNGYVWSGENGLEWHPPAQPPRY